MKKVIAIAAGLLFAGQAAAQAQAVAPSNHIDVFYVLDSKFELDDSVDSLEFSSDGGFGIKGEFNFSDQAFLTAEYQTVDYDKAKLVGLGSAPVDVTFDDLRVGLGFHFSAGSPIYAKIEMVKLEIEIEGEKGDDNGFGAHLGVRDRLDNGLAYYAQVGYLDVGDVGDGFEFLVGGAFNFTPNVGLFVDYRHTQLEEGEFEVTLGEARLGLRLSF